eukprot:g16769.t1
MSAASVQLVRLLSFKTAPKRTSSGASPTSESSASPSTLRSSLLGGKSRASSAAQDRFSTAPSGTRGGEQGAGKNVVMEVFAHGASGKEAVLVAFLSNAILHVLRVGAEGLRSWLLEWPVAAKIRGLCVSPDLQCVLCVTEGLEGVYLLAIDNLGEQGEATPHPTEAVPSLDGGSGAAAASTLHANAGVDGNNGLAGAAGPGDGGSPDGKQGKSGGGNKRSPAAAATTARHAPKRTVADTAFPSLAHLASRGEQRKRGAGSAKARHPLAEPVFIASLARRGAGGGGEESKGGLRLKGDGDRGSRRHSTGSGGWEPRARGGAARAAAALFECLWWVTRDGDHFAIIGGPGGEVHFLDLERLGAWIVAPPPSAMARGRVCALSIVADLTGTPQQPVRARAGSDSAPPPPSEVLEQATTAANGNEQSHLVAVLETGAVFVVLLERSSAGASGGGATGGSEGEGEGEGEAKDLDNTNKKRDGVGNSTTSGGGESQGSPGEYIRLGTDRSDRPEFAPVWLDVGRGGGGGGGGGMGVRAMPQLHHPGRGGNASSGRLRMSIVSRTWGNKCAVKILGVAGTPGAAAGSSGDKEKEPQHGWGRDWGNIAGGSGRQQALRTDTVSQFTLPVDHPVPEQHGLAAVDGSYAVLASPPAGGAPSCVTVAPLGGPERPANHPVYVFPLPAGEHVCGVALLPCGDGESSSADGDGKATGFAVAPGLSWGLVWSECCVYRVDLGVNVGGAAAPKAAADTAGPVSATPKARLPSKTSRQSLAKASGSIALRRPPAAAVRRAYELRAAGELSEATNVAIEALDGVHSSSATPSRGAGGEATTRMVREELANSLLEWLVTLHVRQASTTNLRLATTVGSSKGDRGSVAGTAGSAGASTSRTSTPESGKGKARRSSTDSPAGGLHGRSSARRGGRLSLPSRVAPKTGPKGRESAPATPTKTQNDAASSPAAAVAAAAATSSSQLERYLLSSRDYDPVLAAKILHEHGEADLAIVAGTAREENAAVAPAPAPAAGGAGGGGGGAATVLSRVLRVLTEAAWPPRLGPRAVEALCGDQTGAAAREVVHTSGGTLFAALEPSLQLRVLLSHKSVLFGRAEAGGPAAGGDEREMAVVEEAAVAVEAGASGTVPGVRRLLGPIVPALSTEELNVLVSRLAEWCKEDAAAGRREGEQEGAAVADQQPPSTAALEALEVLLQALCDLGRRPPPPGEHHRRAWSHAGCVIDDELTSEKRRASGAPPLEWAQLTASLCDVVSYDESGLRSNGNGGYVGGLPTAARRQLRRVLPVVWGWHDPVGVLLRLTEAGCWAAVALQLEMSGNRRDAASATLHGVAAYLKGGEGRTQGEIARILSGKASRAGFGAREQTSLQGSTTATEADTKRTASEAIVRVIDKHVFPRGQGEGTADGGETAGPSPPALRPPTSRPPPVMPTSAAVLERASVLSEALCVWKHFALPLASLEACLRPQVEDVGGVRILAAVFFPQLSRDTARNGTSSRDPLGPEELRGARGPRGAGGRVAQTGKAPPRLHDLGLSPGFFLELTRAAGKPAVPGSAASSSRYAPNGARGAVGSAAASSGSSQLALLLEHQAGEGGGSELDSAWVRLGATASHASRRGGRADAGSAWPPVPGLSGAQGYASSYSGRAPAAAVDRHADTAVWYFSCGHRFSRRDLFDSVLPASVSSVRQATASLERTQQVLALEYEGRSSAAAGAACPECAAKELVRLAAVAGSSMQARGASIAGGYSSPLPRPPPPPPPPPPQRLRTLEQPRVR